MEPKLMVLAKMEWSYGNGNGDHEIGIVLPEFDIHDAEERKRAGREALIMYGVPEATINPSTEIYWSDSDTVFHAEMTEYHRPYPEGLKRYTKAVDVEITFQYVWSHRNRVYTPLAEPQDVFIVEPKQDNKEE